MASFIEGKTRSSTESKSLVGVSAAMPKVTSVGEETVLHAPRLGYVRDLQYIRKALLTSLPLWIADQAAICISVGGLFGFLAWLQPNHGLEWTMWPLLFGAASTFAYAAVGLYPGVGLAAADELRLTAKTNALLFLTAFAAHTALEGASSSTSLLLLGGGAEAIALVPYFRRIARRIVAQRTWWSQPVLIFGGGESAAEAYEALRAAPDLGLRPIGIVDDLHRHWESNGTNAEGYAGPWCDATETIERHQVFWGVVPLEEESERDFSQRLDQLKGVLPHLVVTFGGWTHLSRHTAGEFPLAGIPAICIEERLLLPLHKMAKRAMDLVMLAVIAPFVIPVAAFLAFLIFLTSPGPIFFRQKRYAAGGGMFKMLKFRSMVVDADRVLKKYLDSDPEMKAEWERFHKLRKDPRVTRIGKLMRLTSLDELPQIWHVFTGEMSFVGPRPYYEDVSQVAPVITRVRPGITGLWQVSGRGTSTFDERLKIDANYVRDWSPWLDVYILARTIRVVATCDGAY
jgi:Undecaprenyl-phosphate galactose phosphotransferase WbaP